VIDMTQHEGRAVTAFGIHHSRCVPGLCLLTVIALGLAGCSAELPRREDPDTTNLRRIYQAFRICEDFKNRGPRDEAS
jgi:hypothetical protein